MIDLATAKNHLRVDHDADDALIGQYLAAAIAAVENYTGKLLTRREVTQGALCFPAYFSLHYGPSPDLLTIAYTDADDASQVIEDATINGARVYPASAWPMAADNTPVTLTYTAGYATVPAELDSAVLVHVRAQYDEWRTGEKSDAADMAVRTLCAPYRSLRV